MLAVTVAATGWSAEGAAKPKKILYFTKSCGFEHSVVARKDGQPAYSERILVELGKKAGYEIVCSKDGSLFNPDKIGQWDAFAWYATGDLTRPTNVKTDTEPSMTAEGKQALLDAIAAGKGFVGIHAGDDCFHERNGVVDPFIKMLGGEFLSHGAQQDSWMRVTDAKFPGMDGVKDFQMKDEWYSPRNLTDDLHVIVVQDTKGMTGWQYARPPYPSTWARLHGKGRVYYTSLGHREDVWDNPLFQQILMGGIKWAVGDAQAEVPANIKQATPGANEIPKAPEKKAGEQPKKRTGKAVKKAETK
jgi:hypothetical protein